MTRRAVFWTAIGTGVAAIAVILFLSSGFRLFAILTPSMGQTAPVGTLVVSHSADSYQTGDIISFERISRVYTHRIVAIGPDGITTVGFRTDTQSTLDLQAPRAGSVGFGDESLCALAAQRPWECAPLSASIRWVFSKANRESMVPVERADRPAPPPASPGARRPCWP